MQDRLQDLREIAFQRNQNAAEKMRAGPSQLGHGRESNGNADLEAQTGFSDDQKSKFMEVYFNETNAIKASINEIGQTLERIKDLKKQATLSTATESEKEASVALQKAFDETLREVLITKKKLENLKKENIEFAASHATSTESRIRDNLHQALSRKFKEVLLEYQTVQTDYKKDVKGKVERQVKIVCPEASEQELRQMVDEGEVTDIIRTRITGMAAHSSLVNALSDLQDKYRDIRRLEQNVAELHQLFVDLATLVDAQGELLDQIEFSVSSAKDYTEKADKELVTARKHQKSAQKKMCWLSCCVISVAVIIAIFVVIFVLR